MGADSDHEPGADQDPDRRSGQRREHGPAGAQGIGAQDRERAQHDPEGVLKPGPLGDEDGDGQSRRAAEAVAKPDRAAPGVLGGEPLRRLDGGPRRPDGEVSAGDIEVVELGRRLPAGDQGVARDLPRGV